MGAYTAIDTQLSFRETDYYYDNTGKELSYTVATYNASFQLTQQDTYDNAGHPTSLETVLYNPDGTSQRTTSIYFGGSLYDTDVDNYSASGVC